MVTVVVLAGGARVGAGEAGRPRGPSPPPTRRPKTRPPTTTRRLTGLQGLAADRSMSRASTWPPHKAGRIRFHSISRRGSAPVGRTEGAAAGRGPGRPAEVTVTALLCVLSPTPAPWSNPLPWPTKPPTLPTTRRKSRRSRSGLRPRLLTMLDNINIIDLCGYSR